MMGVVKYRSHWLPYRRSGNATQDTNDSLDAIFGQKDAAGTTVI